MQINVTLFSREIDPHISKLYSLIISSKLLRVSSRENFWKRWNVRFYLTTEKKKFPHVVMLVVAL